MQNTNQKEIIIKFHSFLQQSLFLSGLFSRHPIQYHNANAGVNTWRKVVLMYVCPVLLFSLVTNAPKFMETRPKYVVAGTSAYNDSELGQEVWVSLIQDGGYEFTASSYHMMIKRT